MRFGCTIISIGSVAETMKFYKRAFGFEARFLAVHRQGQKE